MYSAYERAMWLITLSSSPRAGRQSCSEQCTGDNRVLARWRVHTYLHACKEEVMLSGSHYSCTSIRMGTESLHGLLAFLVPSSCFRLERRDTPTHLFFE